MEKLEDLKAIVDNAPKGSNFVEDKPHSKSFRYFLRDEFQWFGVSNVCTQRLYELPCFTRSLADIQTIIEHKEQIGRCWEAYARIEGVKQRYNQENKFLKDLLEMVESTGFLQETHDSGFTHRLICKKYRDFIGEK